MSAHKEDFVKLTPLRQAKPIQGIKSGVTLQGKRLVRYVLQAENGKNITIQGEAFYVPDMTPEVRLICLL